VFHCVLLLVEREREATRSNDADNVFYNRNVLYVEILVVKNVIF
jgi:hypothetical protein